MAAPASAAGISAAAIYLGVTGKYRDMEDVSIAPLTAHVMMTFRLLKLITLLI